MARFSSGRGVLGASLGLVSAAAWGLLAFGGHGLILPGFCTAAGTWILPGAVPLDFLLALNPPERLAGAWMLMIAAMMTPLLAAPLRHVRERSFARARARRTALFVVGYAAVWIAACAVLQAVALALEVAAPGSRLPFGLAAAAALAWQVSPAKQACLNRCHRRPSLAAFGHAADRGALAYGMVHGGWCVGSCWALMLLPLTVGDAHLPVMVAVTLFLAGERLDRPAPPAWRWRAPGKACRLALAQSRIRLARFVASVELPFFPIRQADRLN